MAGPWEKYAKQAPQAEAGPWTKYAKPQAAPGLVSDMPAADPRNPDGTYGQPPEGMIASPVTGGMTSRELLRQNVDPSRLEALGVGYMQGFGLNRADELMGLAGRVEGGPEMAALRREQFRATEDVAREKFGGTALAGDVAGAVTSPAAKLLGPVKSVSGAAAQGAALGAAYGSGAADEGQRLEGAAEGAAFGALFGAGAKAVANVGTRGFQRIFKKSVERPTVENLRAAKNAAYKAVEDAGEKFSPSETKALFDTVKAAINESGSYVAGVDKQTGAALNMLQAQSGKPLTLGQLDKVRQAMWARYNASKGGEPLIMEAIDAIDDMILNRGATNDLMQAARLAHSRFKKSELLENAFTKAADQTASTGSGGNILNKYRQAVTSIINNPKQAKWFSADEIETMRNFVRGSFTENQLRRIGKLSPSGNGLMMALNLGAVAVEPAMLSATVAGGLAKAGADRMGERGASALVGMVGGQAPRQAVAVPGAVGALSGAAGGRVDEIQNYLRDRQSSP